MKNKDKVQDGGELSAPSTGQRLTVVVRRRLEVLLFVVGLGVIAMLVTAGVGDGEPTVTPTPTSAINAPAMPNVINGIAVPPDPGAAGLVTVSGIDSDSNGIRDDIDRFIATKYGTNATTLKASRTAARAVQRVLVADAKNKAAALVALQENGDAGVCAGRDFRSVVMQASTELDEIFFRTLNTPNRVAQQKAVDAMGGLFTRDVASAVCQ